MDAILELLGLAAEASYEEVAAAITEENLAQVAETLGIPGATLEQVLATIKALMTPAADEGGDEGGGEAAVAATRATVAMIAKELQLGNVITIGALVAAVGKKLEAAGATDQQLPTLLKRVGQLESENAEHAWDAFLGGPAAGKVTPAMAPTVKSIFMRDRAEAEQLVEQLPKLVGAQSAFAGDRTAGGGSVTVANNEAGWKKEWAANRANEDGVPLQEEFADAETYVAFKKHEKAGHVTILGRKREGSG